MKRRRKYETETVSQEAYAACKADLEQKAAGEQSLLAMAKDNAKEAVKCYYHNVAFSEKRRLPW